MPKVPTDYTKTIIYKLVHKEDFDNANIYIGSTTNFRQRKGQHKTACNNEKGDKYNQKNYQSIRDNGGWNEWNMIEIEKYPCNDKREAETKEESWRIHFNAVLNSKACISSIDDKKEKRKIYREDNKEKRKIYREDNKEKILKQVKQYYDENIQKITEYAKIYCETNKEKIAEKRKIYREDNKEKIAKYLEKNKERIAKYRQDNKERMKIYCETKKEKLAEKKKYIS